MDLRAMLRVVTAGDVRARMGAVRQAQSAVRLARTAAALDLGVLAAVEAGAGTAAEVCSRTGSGRVDLMAGLLDVLVADGLLRRRGTTYRLTRRSRALLADEVAAATYTAFADFHTGVYRDLRTQLTGGPARDDVSRRAHEIALVSEMFEPFAAGAIRDQVRSRRARRVLDVGCGSGHHLVAMLHAATEPGQPPPTGVGIEQDPATAELARARLRSQGFGDRAEVLTGDARELLPGLGDPVDLALLANVVYYLPREERVTALRAVAGVLRPGGALLVVTTALTDELFSRHFDLLLRAQEGRMELPAMDELAEQLAEAGLRPEEPRRIAPGEPLMALVATAPSAPSAPSAPR